MLNEKQDIDKLLVVTFTNAAAAEMRERVLDAIYKKLDENPDDENLQKQIVLLGKSNICTIHSFCLDVIKNNFFEINLPASFRIASTEEIELLKQEVLENVFENFYESENEAFAKLIETYTGYRGDEAVKELVFSIDKLVQATPFPKKWLTEKVEMFNPKIDKGQDFSESIWGKVLLKEVNEEILDAINQLKLAKSKLEMHPEMEKYFLTLQHDMELLQGLQEVCDSWDRSFAYANQMKFKTWPTDKKANIDLKEAAKKARDAVKKKVSSVIEKTLLYSSHDAYQDLYLWYENLVTLKDVIVEFQEKFQQEKRNKNIIDFSDIEHYALEILVKEEDGKYKPTQVAKKMAQKFEEIAIDEYQDSNQVQELILKSISRGHNIFMVGDVKQSIYKFRQACPELFLDKYEKYSLEGNDNGLKIQLFKNFRSNQNILDITNCIFQNIMSKELGDIEYTQEEYLNLGADYPEIEEGVGKSEIHIIDMKEDILSDTQEDSDEFEEEKELDKVEIEARFVAKKIKELIESGKKIKGKNGIYRKIEYRDIVVLLRSTSSVAPIFETEIVKNKIPVFSDATSEYFDTMEIQTILNVLKILDNPFHDIELVAVMRSPIGGFSDNEIVEVRLLNREDSVYANLLEADSQGFLYYEKVHDFLQQLQKWRNLMQQLSLAELIWQIYTDTGFYDFVGVMPNGILRQANLRILFQRAKEYEKTSFNGLFRFIQLTEKLKSSNSDMTAAKVIGENENVVRIMSIHKSKGLEFPVVFLSCCSKKINLQDLKMNVLLHRDFGFGPEYIDYERRIQYPTAAKQAIKTIGKIEAISEEMRILYVALTRAKEKLIITGTVRDFAKDENEKKDNLAMYEQKNGKLNPILMKKYSSYLDWIYLVYLNGKLQNNLELYVHKKDEFVKESQEETQIPQFDFTQEADLETIEKNFAWEYPNQVLVNTPMKLSVSQIKQANKKSTENEIGLQPIDLSWEKKQITPMQKGTLFHLVLQKLDFRKNYTILELQEYLKQLVQHKILKETEEKNIDLKQIMNFLQSEIYKRIRNAKLVEKEKAFCLNTKLEEYQMQEVSVQGMIDLYFIDQENHLVLVDYKTDFVDNEEILIQRYEIQLQLYKKALETSLQKKVDQVCIYSTHLGKIIKLVC